MTTMMFYKKKSASLILIEWGINVFLVDNNAHGDIIYINMPCEAHQTTWEEEDDHDERRKKKSRGDSVKDAQNEKSKLKRDELLLCFRGSLLLLFFMMMKHTLDPKAS